MTRLATIATPLLTLGLLGALTACSGAAPVSAPSVTPATSTVPATSPATPTSSPPSTTTAPATSSTTTPATPTKTSTKARPGSTTASTPVVDQTSPEGAMTSWLASMVAGKSETVCSLMASGGTPISQIQGAAQKCADTVEPTVKDLSKIRASFDGLKISGATVNADQASFEAARTTPALAAPVIATLKAVKIGSKWYITP